VSALMKCILRLSIWSLLAAVFSGCSTTVYTVKTIPADAEILEMSEKDLEKPIKNIGKGEVKFQNNEFAGKIVSLRAASAQRVLVVFPKVNQEGIITLTLPPADASLQARLAELEAQLSAERRQSAELKTNVEKRVLASHAIARLLSLAQRHLTSGALSEAERVISESSKIPEEFLPAAVFTLQGKIFLAQNRRSEARKAFSKALALSDKESEARSLIESAR
jgi:hypothetical protein